MRIKSFIINNNIEIKLGKINLFVGPKNVGKTQTLKDINIKMFHMHAKTVILDSINYEFVNSYKNFNPGIITKELNSNFDYSKSKLINSNTKNYNNIDGIQGEEIGNLKRNFSKYKIKIFDEVFIDKSKVLYLDVCSRLEIANSIFGVNPYKGMPIIFLQSNMDNLKNIENELAKIVNLAFGKNIQLDYFSQGKLTFKINPNKFKKNLKDCKKLNNYINSFSIVDNQINAFKSFVCIILSILLFKDKIILIDEPEAFLHPTQIEILGNLIGEYYLNNNNQILIATRSYHFFGSILKNNQISAFRLNRDHGFTQFDKISFKELEQIDKNPILYSLPILESLFYNGVVLCEGDSDRMFYKKVMNKIASDYDDKILFINTHGKHTMKNIIPFIKSSNIPFKLIVDFDLLLSGDEFDKIIKELATERNYTKMISKRKKFSQIITNYGTEVEGEEEELQKHIFQKLIRLLNKKSETKNNSDLSKLRKNIENFSRKSKVDRIKKNGINAIDAENVPLVQQIIENSKKIGLFIVPYGDLECWIKHNIEKKKWIEYALTNIDNNISIQLHNFITDIYGSFKKKK